MALAAGGGLAIGGTPGGRRAHRLSSPDPGDPAHRFFGDGLRCVQRHPRMWIWLSVLGLAYTFFQIFGAYQLGEAQFSLASLLHWPEIKPHDWRAAAGHAWLPALSRWPAFSIRQWSAIPPLPWLRFCLW